MKQQHTTHSLQCNHCEGRFSKLHTRKTNYKRPYFILLIILFTLINLLIAACKETVDSTFENNLSTNKSIKSDILTDNFRDCVKYNSIECVQYCLKNDCLINLKVDELFNIIAKYDSVNIYDLLIRNSIVTLTQESEYGYSIFFYAAEHDSIDLLSYLLNHGIKVDNIENNYTPLLHSFAFGPPQYKTVEFLINHGADVNAKDDAHYTPLLHAVRLSDFAMIKYLIEKEAEVNVRDGFRSTPLMYASCRSDSDNQYDTLKLLIDKGATVQDVDNAGQNALHYYCGCIKKNSTIDKRSFLLLINSGIDPNDLNYRGQSPHDLSLVNGNRKLIALLSKYHK